MAGVDDGMFRVVWHRSLGRVVDRESVKLLRSPGYRGSVISLGSQGLGDLLSGWDLRVSGACWATLCSRFNVVRQVDDKGALQNAIVCFTFPAGLVFRDGLFGLDKVEMHASSCFGTSSLNVVLI